jgi:hypothetical protein
MMKSRWLRDEELRELLTGDSGRGHVDSEDGSSNGFFLRRVQQETPEFNIAYYQSGVLARLVYSSNRWNLIEEVDPGDGRRESMERFLGKLHENFPRDEVPLYVRYRG